MHIVTTYAACARCECKLSFGRVLGKPLSTLFPLFPPASLKEALGVLMSMGGEKRGRRLSVLLCCCTPFAEKTPSNQAYESKTTLYMLDQNSFSKREREEQFYCPYVSRGQRRFVAGECARLNILYFPRSKKTPQR